MRPDPADHYATLGVADTAPHLVIQRAYRDRMRLAHPDVAGVDPRVQRTAADLNAAWAVLRDPRRRAEYDRARSVRLARATAPASQSGQPLDQTPSWGPAGPRHVSAQHLREAAARSSAYGLIGEQTRAAFGRASMRTGWLIVGVGSVLLALFLRA